MEYMCEHCGEKFGKAIGGGLLIERSEDEGFFNFRLCADCMRKFVGFVDAFVEPCKKNHKVEGPHKIVNEDVLLKEATRQDVRDFLIAYGIDEEMAFAISEKVRKGHFSSRDLPEEMMNAMEKAAVPEWFIDGCRKVLFLSDKNNYSAPSLVDDEEPEEDRPEFNRLIKLEITEC